MGSANLGTACPLEQAADALAMVAKMTAVRIDPSRMATVRTADDAVDSSFLTCTTCQETRLRWVALRRIARRVHIKIRGSTNSTDEDWFFLRWPAPLTHSTTEPAPTSAPGSRSPGDS